ncbi:MAG TPA: 6-phosphogluconolactonase [Polyangium sp.]|nr:6-phosphogluconolactonase [Polyangium sp.]
MTVVSTGWDVVRANDENEHALLGAELLARAIDDAVRVRGRALVALSGGTTPGPAYRKLAECALPLDRIDWFWVDERAVAPDHLRSNYRAAFEDLQLGRVAPERVHRMEAEAADLASAAVRYEHLLRQTFGVARAVAFDAMTLGIGDDGHLASLFPNTGAVVIEDRLVAAIDAQSELGIEARLTLTAPVICEAGFVLIMARGARKRAPVSAAFLNGPEDAVPARLLHRARGKLTWLFDTHVQDTT